MTEKGSESGRGDGAGGPLPKERQRDNEEEAFVFLAQTLPSSVGPRLRNLGGRRLCASRRVLLLLCSVRPWSLATSVSFHVAVGVEGRQVERLRKLRART
jgi:hypothetical protein